MEKSKPSEKKKTAKESSESSDGVIWDCGSSLYDSFELRSFQTQLDSALVSKTLSMPHLSDSRLPAAVKKKQGSKISRSFQRLIRKVFKPKSSTSSVTVTNKDWISDERFYVVYDDAISTIPEDELRRSASTRFTSAASLPTSLSLSRD
ncbi:hypothetical protein C2S51_032615 [Perilla frutescens var. frutescens]|nr:hypothetical protein C2S51_032615 [Perilla frutescens var. frutescens]